MTAFKESDEWIHFYFVAKWNNECSVKHYHGFYFQRKYKEYSVVMEVNLLGIVCMFEWSLIYFPLMHFVPWTNSCVWMWGWGCLSIMWFDPLLMMSWHLLSRALHLGNWHLIRSDGAGPASQPALCLPGMSWGVTGRKLSAGWFGHSSLCRSYLETVMETIIWLEIIG